MGINKDWGRMVATNVLSPQVIATDTATLTSAIDASLYRKLSFIISTGAVTDGTYTPILQSSDAVAGTYADDDAVLDPWAAIVAADDDETVKVDVDLDAVDQQWLKVEVTSASTSTGALIGITAVGELKSV